MPESGPPPKASEAPPSPQAPELPDLLLPGMASDAWPGVRSAAVPVAARGGRVVSAMHRDTGRQLSIFGAETIESSPLDLAGLLAGPGRLDRMGGTARVSVHVDAAWRVHVLMSELISRGLVVNWRALDQHEYQHEDRHEGQDEGQHEEDQGAGLFEVRTAYSSRLNGLARAWPAASGRLFLSGPSLRLWVAAAGRAVAGGFALGLNPVERGTTVDAALRRAGLDGVVSDHGLLYLISGRKPLQRLSELVGERPAAAPPALWPGGASA